MWHAVWVMDLCDSADTANSHLHPTALPRSQEEEWRERAHMHHTALYGEASTLRTTLTSLSRIVEQASSSYKVKEQHVLTSVLLIFQDMEKPTT